MVTLSGPAPPAVGPASSAAAGAGPARVEAAVVAVTRQGAVLDTPAGRLLFTVTPPPPRGASLILELASSGGTGRLLAIDGRVLRPPRLVRLAPAPSPLPSPAKPPLPTFPARVMALSGHATGPTVAVRITPLPGRPSATPAPRSAPTAGLPPGATLPAEAAGRDALGRLLLRAPGLILRLEAGTVDLPPGVRLRLIFPHGLPSPATPQGRNADPVRALADSLLAAEAEDGNGGAPSPARRLPRPDATLAARLLHLHRSIRGGDASPMRDKAPEALGELARLAREPLPGGWRATLLPVMVDGTPTPLRLYRRAEDRAAPGGTAGSVQRAVFDVDLSHLGRLQLDVLCQGRRFDLLVRSAADLPPGLRAEIAALFDAARDVAGLRGDLGFRPGGLLALPDPQTPPVGVTA